jgi:spore maturation protein CgeB
MRKTGRLRIVYIGWLWPGGTALQRFHALENLGHAVTGVDATPRPKPWILELPFRVSGKLFRLGLDAFGPRDRNKENASVIRLFHAAEWDVLWLDKGTTVEADTLAEVQRLQPRCRIIGYSPDDMCARHNQSLPFLQSLPLYDVYFTTKSYRIGELGLLGAREVRSVDNAYDPSTHRPMEVKTNDRERLGGRVGFIGAYEAERHRSMKFLAVHGVSVRVWGPNWLSKRISKGLRVERRCLWGDDYAMATCAFDINLGFLRKINRDLQTTRSVEIPACGAFMLAERTDEHRSLFEEGKEAEYFDSDEELLDKARYYLGHEDERKRIAAAGRDRCIRSGYSNEARLSNMLEMAMRRL